MTPTAVDRSCENTSKNRIWFIVSDKSFCLGLLNYTGNACTWITCLPIKNLNE